MRKWALITGASTGIGLELARVFARNDFNLVLVARNEARLKDISQELQTAYGIETQPFPKDLSQPEAASDIFESLRSTPISILVNNAGFGSYGPFAQADLSMQSQMMQVNMISLVQLTHLFV